MVTIVSDTGEELATATLRKGSDNRTLAVERVAHGKGRLFRYYFNQGRRSVMIESGDFRLTGTIATRWVGAERLWQVRLAHPAELDEAGEETARYPASTLLQPACAPCNTCKPPSPARASNDRHLPAVVADAPRE